MEEVKHQKCTKCKCWRLPDTFLNPKGRLLKTCQKCRDRGKVSREKYKCTHGKSKSQCKDCGGSSFCEHGKRKSQCKECGGSSICEHGRQKSKCKECGGGAICEHGRQKHRCKECGGSSICEHGRVRTICKPCGGSSICEHKKQRNDCKICDPLGYLSSIVRCRTWTALKGKKTKRTMEYLKCSVEELKIHLENQFTDGMTWENQGKWHIDHIIPLKYGNPTLEETIDRLHYTNTQPLWAVDNIAKGNRFIG